MRGQRAVPAFSSSNSTVVLLVYYIEADRLLYLGQPLELEEPAYGQVVWKGSHRRSS